MIYKNVIRIVKIGVNDGGRKSQKFRECIHIFISDEVITPTENVKSIFKTFLTLVEETTIIIVQYSGLPAPKFRTQWDSHT